MKFKPGILLKIKPNSDFSGDRFPIVNRNESFVWIPVDSILMFVGEAIRPNNNKRIPGWASVLLGTNIYFVPNSNLEKI